MIKAQKGTSLAYFWLSNGVVRLVNNSGVLEFQDASGNPITVRAKQIPATGQDVKDVATYLDLRGVGALISFSFDGASTPAAGTNTGLFGFCHTTGGSFTAGDVVYDDGTTVTKQANIRLIITGTAVTGTISLNANGVYALQSGTWTLKGDGTASNSYPPIKVAFTYSDTTVTSTTSIPDTAEVFAVRLVITTAFNGTSPTIAAATDGSAPTTLIASSAFDVKQAEQYGADDIIVLGTNKGGHVVVTVTSSTSSAGVGYVEVFYAIPAA